jgi:hypothetical protein
LHLANNLDADFGTKGEKTTQAMISAKAVETGPSQRVCALGSNVMLC